MDISDGQKPFREQFIPWYNLRRYRIAAADSINLKTWNKNEVYIKASVNINEGKDNEAYITSFDETGKTVFVDAHFKDKYFKGKNNCCNATAKTGRNVKCSLR